MRRGVAAAPGTCGELVQGWLGEQPFLITFPVDRFARAVVELEAGPGELAGPPKARRAVARVLELLQEGPCRGRIRIRSGLPPGKGMASSTADVVAAAQAAARALGRELPPGLLARIALEVEPSDGLMLPGIALFDHRGGRVMRVLAEAPPWQVLLLDRGGTVDTERFNASPELPRREARREGAVREALALVERGLASGRGDLVGRGATISAQAQEEVLGGGELGPVLEWAREAGAWGVSAAHSGTVLGVIFPSGRRVKLAPPLACLGWARCVGGGVR
ncbi:MAG: GHMP kinase [Thermaerobacter sp.]|nr:GHMP kinase [Thermaerobacter sp.]